MSETIIETDVVYQHEQMGEVLVTGIAKMYDEWDVSGPSDDIDSGDVLVFYHDRFDGYGGMQPTPSTENVNEFAKMVERDRSFEYVDTPDLRED